MASVTASATSKTKKLRNLGVALVIVDLQYDFLPGGALAVADSDAVLHGIRALLRAQNSWDSVIATQDYHPAGHVSFASTHACTKEFESREVDHPLVPGEKINQVLWPEHCVQGTTGVKIHSEVLALMKHLRDNRLSDVVIIRKGSDQGVDAYSGLSDNAYSRFSPLARYLSSMRSVRGGFKQPIDIAVVVGLATDYCVLSTAMDLLKFGVNTIVPRDSVRGVDEAGCQEALDKLASSGAILVEDVTAALEEVSRLERNSQESDGRPYLERFAADQQRIWDETVAAET